tara:strand:+ start:150 stop:1223 length:1074 start_codon:yes stop_codon:yes gene_type:complete
MDISEFLLNSNYKNGGLKNIGATCYINTLIQCLCSCSYFVNFILSEKYLDRIQNDNVYFIKELKSIVNSLLVDGNSLIPVRFLKTLKLKFDFIDINQQNDLHEILLLILNKMNEEIKISDTLKYFDTNILRRSINNSDTEYKKLDDKCYKMWYELHKKEYSELVELFYGHSISQIVCGNCNFIHHNNEFFNILDLEIPEKDPKIPIDIYDCIEKHTSIEFLNYNIDDDKWKCDVCNESKKSGKVIKHWKFPPILIICLKRFYFDKNLNRMTKNNTYIDIPFELDLKDYTMSNKSKTKYKLQSVGLHFGNIYGGHYSSVVRKDKNTDDKWLLIDDLTINKINKKDINLNSAYMLFYSL